jgi:hypothetical protein
LPGKTRQASPQPIGKGEAAVPDLHRARGTQGHRGRDELPVRWTKTFTDPRLCAAIVDRLTFNGTIIETGTDSYRLATTRARQEQAS